MNEDINTMSAEMIEGTAYSMREERRMRLLDSDWSVLPDSPLTDEQRAEWQTYRQKLRDLTSHEDWPLVPNEDLPVSPSGMPFYGALALEAYNPPVEPSAVVYPPSRAPVPTLDAANVTALLGEAYTCITIHELSPDWGQESVLEREFVDNGEELIPLIHISRLNFQGCNIADFGQDEKIGVDVSRHSAVYMDFWLNETASFRFGIVSHSGPGEFVQKMVTLNGEAGWNTVNLSLTDFPLVDTSNITQIVWDNSVEENATKIKDLWLDNLYFNNEPAAAVAQVS